MFFFFDAATARISTLSLHDALPISKRSRSRLCPRCARHGPTPSWWTRPWAASRSEEHTSELQSRPHIVCRLLLEKKNSYRYYSPSTILNFFDEAPATKTSFI